MKRASPGFGVRNRFNVPKSFWRKLPPIGRQVFNTVFESMRDSQSVFVPSTGIIQSQRSWRVVCWNAAFTAASACRPRKAKR